jgi:hypothetical protein
MPRPTDLVGLAGAAVLVAATVVAVGRLLGLRRCALAVLAGAGAVAALVPLGTLPLAGLLRGVVGDLSVTTLVLLLRGVARGIRGEGSAHARTALALQGLVAVGGLVLYPLTLGLGARDPYRLGYGDPWFLAALLAVALAALVLDAPLVTFCTAVGVLAWSVEAYESRNLWDCLIDPLVFTWAASALLVRGARTAARGAGGRFGTRSES